MLLEVRDTSGDANQDKNLVGTMPFVPMFTGMMLSQIGEHSGGEHTDPDQNKIPKCAPSYFLIAERRHRSCRQHTYRAPHFPMHSCCAVSLQSCCHRLTPCTCTAQVTKHIVCVSPKNTHTSRNEKIETGAVVTGRRGSSGIERGKGICHQWKDKGQRLRGDQCSFRHESHDRAPKPTPKAAPPSEPPTPKGRNASRKRSLRGRRQSGKSNRQPCNNFLEGTCTELLCD